MITFDDLFKRGCIIHIYCMETRSQFYCKLDINYPLKLHLKQLLVATSNNFPTDFDSLCILLAGAPRLRQWILCRVAWKLSCKSPVNYSKPFFSLSSLLFLSWLTKKKQNHRGMEIEIINDFSSQILR